MLERPSSEDVNFGIILSFKLVCMCVLGEEHGTRLCSHATRDSPLFHKGGSCSLASLTIPLTVIVRPPGGTAGVACRLSAFHGQAPHSLRCPRGHASSLCGLLGAAWRSATRPQCGLSNIVLTGASGDFPGPRRGECQATPRGLRGAILTHCVLEQLSVWCTKDKTQTADRHVLHL